ncbi:MAG: DNA sulfur modification protein DndD [Proteobacteria bacterium]|jgi:DNA sulfur modification protein DndD|nr:DNA sulfur modification protein DndD [Pseudomonadota bacterium]
MILDELTFHDFGVYRGRQTFHLTPKSDEQPIILIGARNGGGKTTFLEGLQLAFFGRLSQAFRGGVSYEEYLRRSINRAASPQDGAAVEVKFRRVLDGREQGFRIRRTWSVQKGGVRETFEAFVEGAHDRVLTEQWAEYVEEMLPPRIAPLFFFDGEKIEQFADLGRSGEIVGTAVNALLGLDIVERLQTDLDVFERRKAASHASLVEQQALKAAADAIDAAQARLDIEQTARASAKRNLERRGLLLDRAHTAFKNQGGDLFEARQAILAEDVELVGALGAVNRSLRAWAGELAPLMMVEDLLGEVAVQAERESQADTAKAVLGHLTKRDRQVIQKLKSAGANGVMLHEIGAYLDDDRKKVAGQAATHRYLDMTRSARSQLDTVMEQGLPAAREVYQALMTDLDGLTARKDDVERRAAAIPAPETIAPLVAAIEAETDAKQQAEAQVELAERAVEAAERTLAAARLAYRDTMERQVHSTLQAEDAQRMLEHSARVRETLARFKAEVVGHHVHRIEVLVLEALTRLLRKEDLVTAVTIDPVTFAIGLSGGGWDALPFEQLSAGERQLFAIALLWALAQASGQTAPTVIDTPLGRLDSGHRQRLVDGYFPHAGHQVILLSTDEEIDARHHARLEPFISHSMTVEFDPAQRSSRVREGYAFARVEEIA